MRRLIATAVALLLLVACGGGYSPFDDAAIESGELAQEYAEGRRQAELYDQYRDELYDQYASEASTEMAVDALEDVYSDFDSATVGGDRSFGCPNGCTYHPPDCDIKGNISINTGEKIYHVPGQEYYNATRISPEYGERWFCTEAEAISNGWRRADV